MRFKLVPAALTGLLVLALLAACGDGSGEEAVPSPTRDAAAGNGEPTPTAVTPDQPVVPTPGPGGPPGPEQPAPVDAARTDLADRLGIDVGAIAVVSVEAVEWRNACLGAARPDEVCAQVITPGYRVVLRADDSQYVYHTDTGTHVRPAP